MNQTIRHGIARSLAAAAIILVASSPALANSNTFGVVRPYFYADSLYIDTAGTQRAGVPACATRPLMRLNVTADSAQFKQEYAMLLAQWEAGRGVQITGLNTCTSEGDEIILSIVPQ